MVEPNDLAEFGLELTKAFKAHLEQKTKQFEAKVAALQSEVKNLPVPKDGDPGKDAAPPELPDFKAMLLEIAGPVIEEIKALAAEVKAIPVPKDGDHGVSPELPDFDPIIDEKIAKAVAALPAPQPGKDAVLPDIAAMVSAEVKAFTDTIETPKNGDPGISPKLPDIDAMVKAAVDPVLLEIKSALESVKPGEDGKSVGIDDVLPALMAELKSLVAAIPPAAPGISPELPDIAAMVQKAVSSIHVPVPELPDIEGMVKSAVADEIKSAVSAMEIPAPKDGESVTVEQVLPELKAALSDLVSALPPAVPGKDADPVDLDVIYSGIDEKIAKAVSAIKPDIIEQVIDPAILAEEVQKQVAEVVKALPAPEPGRDGRPVDMDEVKSVLSDLVSALPAPKDGDSIDPVDIKVMVDEAVSEIAKGLTPPEPVAPDYDRIEARLSEMVSEVQKSIRTPEDGRDADPEKIMELVDAAIAKAIPEPVQPDMAAIQSSINEMFAKAVEALPVPANGTSVTLEDVAPILSEMIEKAVSAIPPQKDPVGLASALIDREGSLVLVMSDGLEKNLGRVVSKEKSKPVELAAIPVPDELAELTAKAIRMMAELPDLAA